MPAHQGFRPDDRDSLKNRRKPAIQLDEEQAIAARELDPTAHFALQHGQLMAERGILCFKSALGLERRGNQVQKEEYQRGHQPTLSDFAFKSKRMRFSVHTGR
jgi:hypothetical protein